MKKILSSPLFYPSLLIFICLFIAFKSYTPGTFLTGWDTLHPEFNFSVNFSRLISGVWRSEQGFGAVSGHSAMADLPRVFILWLFHFIFPLSFLRYSYIFLCLIIGPLGIYFLLKYLFKNNHISFLGALFYIFNLSTVQQFYVPFEMFPTQWAYLPWVMLYTTKYLTHHSSKDLKLFALFTLLSTPQAYAAHLWYPFFGAFILFLTIHFFLHRHPLKLYSTIVLTLLIINSFWLLPNIYYLATSSWIPRQNQQNRLHSQEFLLKNRETGNIQDSTLIKGFYFNWEIFNFDSAQSSQLMPQWQSHLKNFDIRLIGYALFIFSLIGLILTFIKKDINLLPFTPFFIIPFILLSNKVPPFNYIFDFLLKITILQEVLRFIFTKISILMLFGQTIYLGYFLLNISKHIKASVLIPIFSLLFLIYTAPIFTGNLIAPQLKINIPNEYFQFWKYMNQQPPGKILALPLFNSSGWVYNSWKYQGSGFIWFGLPQSITDRDSDRWDPTNEEAYREINTSLYSNNTQDFHKYLTKYKLNYIFIDWSIIPTNPKNRDQVAYKFETLQILDNLIAQNIISNPIKFGEISIYKINNSPSLVQVGTDLPNITPKYQWHNFDNAYQGTDYQTNELEDSTSIPFRDILDSTNRLNINKFDPQSNNLPQINFTVQDILKINQGKQNVSLDSTNNTVSISTRNVTHGINFDLNDLPHQFNYLVGIKSQYLSGIPLRLCFKNTTTNLCVPEEELSKNITQSWDYFLVPSSGEYTGYNLELNAISYANVLSLSQVEAIKIFILPPSEPMPLTLNSSQNINYTSHLNSSLIKISDQKVLTSSHLILNQSFNSGWLAFYFEGFRPVFLKDHILINNWANGWELPPELANQRTSELNIYIFFWPQLLEFLGFTLLIGTFVWVFKKR